MNWLLLLTTLAHAGSAPKLYGSPDAAEHYQIRVTPAAECQKLIEDTLYSAGVIKEGISAISELADSKLTPADCLEQTLAQWKEEIPEPEFVPAPESEKKPEQSLSNGLGLQLTQLLQKKGCFEGKKKYCHGNPPVPKAEYDSVNKEINATRAQISRNWAAVRAVSSLLLSSPEIDNRRQKEISQKLWKCEQDFTASESAKKWHCGKDTLSAKEYDLLNTLATDESKKVFKAETAYAEKKERLDAELDRIFAEQPELWTKVLAFVPEVKCINPHNPISPAFDTFNANLECEGKTTRSGLAQARKKAESLTGTASRILGDADRRKNERAEKIAKSTAALNGARNFSYNLRALLARYEAFLRRGGKPEELKSFCKENESLQLRDFAFHPAGEKMGANLVSYAQDSRFLGIAKQYGLTEGEISAIYNFTGSFYTTINSAILEDKISPELSSYKKMLESGLAKLPPYQEGPVKRFVTFPDEVVKEHKVGSVVCYKPFSSTSKRSDWHWSGKQELLIYPAKNGKDVSVVSGAESESEVLFTANSCFKVLEANGDATKFVLGEVDKSGKVIAKIPEKEQP